MRVILAPSRLVPPIRQTFCYWSLKTLLHELPFFLRPVLASHCSAMSSSSSLSASPDKVVECVPNFSEGRRTDVIEAIASAIRDGDGCTLLDVDPGESTNRTVYTFVGSPLAVVAGALRAARAAHRLIDMAKHHGIILHE